MLKSTFSISLLIRVGREYPGVTLESLQVYWMAHGRGMGFLTFHLPRVDKPLVWGQDKLGPAFAKLQTIDAVADFLVESAMNVIQLFGEE